MLRHVTSRVARWGEGSESSRAFTIIELLFVIGIVGLLIAILLPVLSKAREAANQVKCMSNLRQLSAAFIMYANNNRDSFPGAAYGDWNCHVTDDQGDIILWRPRSTDWIYWQIGRDINQSAIAVYLGARGETLREVFKCPSDAGFRFPQPRPNSVPPSPYPYSYAMNELLDGDPLGMPPGYRPPRFSHIRHASEKVLLGEPDQRLLGSGSWDIGSVQALGVWSASRLQLSIRHDGPSGLADPLPAQLPPVLSNPGRRGNVALCDGHVEFVPRSFAATREHADPRF